MVLYGMVRAQVESAAPDAKQCLLDGSALVGATCWEAAHLTVHTVDQFGNQSTKGGDKVTASIKRKGADDVVKPEVLTAPSLQ